MLRDPTVVAGCGGRAWFKMLRANWITQWYAYDRGVLDALGLAQHERIAGFIHIGRPPGPPEDRPRPPLNEIAVRFTAWLPEADRSVQGERRARMIRWFSSMSARGETINFYSES